MRYYSNHPGYRPLPSWLGTTVNREIMNHRFREAAIDRALVNRLTKRVDMAELGLVQRDASGALKAAAPVDKVRTMAIPVGMMMILLFSVMSGAPQLLNSVIEEKMSRISEVLIGSITPFELMMGKLTGCVAVSVLLAAIYVAGGVAVAQQFGYADAIRATDLAWLLLFLLMASFMFGSIFITIGAACSDLKDAQGMMTPAMLIMMFPWMTWFAILNAPDSPISVALSMFPDQRAVPDAAAHHAAARSAGLADRAVGRARGGDVGRGGLRGRQDLPHRPPDAGQGGDVRRNVAMGARRAT